MHIPIDIDEFVSHNSCKVTQCVSTCSISTESCVLRSAPQLKQTHAESTDLQGRTSSHFHSRFRSDFPEHRSTHSNFSINHAQTMNDKKAKWVCIDLIMHIMTVTYSIFCICNSFLFAVYTTGDEVHLGHFGKEPITNQPEPTHQHTPHQQQLDFWRFNQWWVPVAHVAGSKGPLGNAKGSN